MVSCAVRGCKSRSTKSTKRKDNITFHRIPKDEQTRQKWIMAFMNQNQWLSHSSRICSRHFTQENFYETKKGFKKIHSYAVPDSNLPLPLTCDTADKEPSFNSLNNQSQRVQNISTNSIATENPVDTFSEMECILETPRKAKLRRDLSVSKVLASKRFLKIKSLQAKNRRLVKKTEQLNTVITQLKRKRYISNDIADILTSNTQISLLNNIYKKKKRGKLRPTYSNELKKFALTLNYYSPSGYRYVRKTFDNCLPSTRTIRNWYSNINGEPGFTEESFYALKKKIDYTQKKLLFSLITDEMCLRNQKMWNGRKYEGLVDIGVNRDVPNNDVAKEAYVFLLVCVNEKWKLPVGYFFINGLDGEQRANLIKQCLQKCDEVGAEVVSVTFDGCRPNLTAMRKLGCQIDDVDNIKCYFTHPSSKRDVVVFLDACHMLKLVKNTLQSKNTISSQNGNSISWTFLENLLKLQENEGLHLANKLGPLHINFQNYKMKVKLASQLFSESVATALEFCKNELKLPHFKDAEETIYFIYIVNYLFDVLNSRSLKELGLRKPIVQENKQTIFEFLEIVRNYLKTLYLKIRMKRVIKKCGKKITIYITKPKPIINSANRTGFIGFILCIDSFKKLFNDLVIRRKLLKFIPTYKCSQDHIELLFGGIRAHGGYNDNPNTRQFKAIYKKMLTHLELMPSFSGNCIPLEDLSILKTKPALKTINQTAPRKRHDDIDLQEEINPTNQKIDQNYLSVGWNYLSVSCNEIILTECTEQIISYVVGSVIKIIANKIDCETCLSSLLATHELSYHKLIFAKDKGRLCYPSADAYQTGVICEKVLRTLIKEGGGKSLPRKYNKQAIISLILKEFVGANVFNFLLCFTIEDLGSSFTDCNHRVRLIRLLVEKYIDIRMHYMCKKENERQSKRNLYKKIIHVSGN